MPDEQSLRAFVAINLPDGVRSGLVRRRAGLKSALPGDGLRWVQPEQIHLTLKFLGAIPAASLPDLRAALSRACAGIAPFSLCAESLGVFPDARRPRVIWTDVNGDRESLRRLQEQIARETGAWREAEPRPFQPHLTLARVKHLNPREAQLLSEHLGGAAEVSFGSWAVTGIDLMQSRLRPAGAEYFRLAEFALAATI
jgi:2'-5' RNA ligase